MQNITCFVASAFGYKDVDFIYDKVVKSTLKELEIRPLRVDRINHNDKIDKKIIELINQSDFGIVDLTYARPSAYYEAGYLEGMGKGVIFISRKDHFKPNVSDPLGNQKIHFDLITKNIIPWTTPNAQFKKVLKARIKLITKPIIFKRRIGTEEINSKREFESLPLTNRLKVIRDTTLGFLKKSGFRKIKGDSFSVDTLKRGKVLAKVEVYNSISRDDLFFFHFRDSKNLETPEKYFRLFCSLKQTPKSRIEMALRAYHPIKDKIYQNGNTTIFIIDSIDSVFKLSRKLDDLFLI